MARLKMHKKIFNISVAFFVILSLLFFRTGYLQIIEGGNLREKAISQQTRGRPIRAKRGSILDRNGQAMAVSGNTEVIGVNCSELRSNTKKNKSIESIAQRLSEILELNYEYVLQKISKKSSSEVLKRRVEKEQTEKLRKYILENKIVGITIDEDRKRYYPYGNLASHIIGFVGDDHQGLWGIEKILDDTLKGKEGKVKAAKNAKGITMPFNDEQYINPEDGNSAVLTIDSNIQHFAETHLENIMKENKVVNGGVCIVVDVKTGELLALATKPTYDLNNPFSIDNIPDSQTREQIKNLPSDQRSERIKEELNKLWKNKAIVDSYEPGSTFKTFVTAMGMELGVIDFNAHLHCSGSAHVLDKHIRCWKTSGHGSQSFIQGLRNSCNVVFINLGLKIGKENFYKYYEKFGFKRKTGIEFPGETIGIFHNPAKMTDLDLAVSSIGQSFQVTPLQMVYGISAIANGGKLTKPQIIKKITDKDGNTVTEYENKVVEQVIPEVTSKKLCEMLEGVVSEGGGKKAFIPGYRVAGKTGTAEKLPRGNGKYVSSFLGFAPANDPKIACLLLVDEPTNGQYYGGVIAAPGACKVMEDTLNYLNVPRQYTDEELQTLKSEIPNITGLTVNQARSAVTNQKLKIKIEGNGTKVITQIPKAGEKVNIDSFVIAYTEELSNESNMKPANPAMTVRTFIQEKKKRSNR